VLGVFEKVRELGDRFDLCEVDERLDRLTLAEVEAEDPSVVGPVLVLEPVAEQALSLDPPIVRGGSVRR